MKAIAAASLPELEQIIGQGLRTFVDVGHALAAIRDGELYKATHKTFEAYCVERWDFNKSRASQLITAAEAATNVYHGKLPAPTNERQARELAKLKEPEQQASAWAQAVKTAPDGVVTGKQVTKEVTSPPRASSAEPATST